MVAGSGGDTFGIFGLGFAALLLGALGVQYSKWLEVGSRRHLRDEPNPYFKLVRLSGALLFLFGLSLIAWSAWILLT